MDPQQRLLLEVRGKRWRHAGLAPDGLAGSSDRRLRRHLQQRLLPTAGPAVARMRSTPTSPRAAPTASPPDAIAYFLGLQGPALSIDTACSSSLVALHTACQSLRRGESSLALCGGVNVMCSPETTIALSKAHMLAPDGRCKTFDARSRRLLARRRLRRARAQAPRRRPRGRRSGPRGDPRHGRQPGRPQRRPDGAERPGAGGGDPRGAGRRRHRRLRTSTMSRRTAPELRSATRSRCAPWPARSVRAAAPTPRCGLVR